jgi:hypothetical protein
MAVDSRKLNTHSASDHVIVFITDAPVFSNPAIATPLPPNRMHHLALVSTVHYLDQAEELCISVNLALRIFSKPHSEPPPDGCARFESNKWSKC